MTQTQPYFNKKKIRQLFFIFGLFFSVICLVAWLIKGYSNIHFDWSVFLPFVGIFSGFFPVATSVIDWFEKKTAAINNRLNSLELSLRALEEKSRQAEEEREEVRGRLIRLEITYKSFLDK